MATMLKCGKCGMELMKKDAIMGNAVIKDDKACVCPACVKKEKDEERIKSIQYEKDRKAGKHQINENPLDSDIFQKLRVVPYLLALLCFLMPFITVSCGGDKLISFTGLQLTIGQKITMHDFDKFDRNKEYNNADMDEYFKKLGIDKSSENYQTGNQNEEAPNIKKEDSKVIGPDIFIVFTAICIVLCIVVSFINFKTSIINIILSVIACGLLIAFKIKCDNETARDGSLILNIEYNIGYILTFILMICAGIYNWIIYQKYDRVKRN